MKRFTSPLALFAAALAATLTVTALFATTAHRQDRLRLERLADSYEHVITDRLNTYIIMLRGIEGLVASGNAFDREQFDTYAARLDIVNTYPGVQGLGYALTLPPDDYTTAAAALEDAGFDDLRLWPEGERDTYSAIVLLHPHDERNEIALGFDMTSEERRRTAMMEAVETDEPRITLPIELVQEIDENVQPGFLIYLPVHFTDEDGNRNFLGWSYSPFRAHDFFNRALRPIEIRGNIEVHDMAAGGELLYAAQAGLAARSDLAAMRRITVAGADWTLTLRPDRGFFAYSQWRYVWTVLIAGLLLTGGLFAFMLQRERATENLQLALDEKEAANETTTALLREVNHRVANSLAIVSAMVRMQARQSPEGAKDALEDTAIRIQAIGEVHRNLYTSENVKEVNLARYLPGLLEGISRQYGGGKLPIELETEIGEVRIAPDKAVALAVIASELITNAYKYAFRTRGGEITVSLSLKNQTTALFSVIDNGEGFIEEGPKSTKIGTKIISAMVERLDAEAEWHLEAGKTGLVLEFPTGLPAA